MEEAQKAGAEGTPAANEGAGEQKPVRVRPKFNPLAIALNVGIPPAVCAGIGIGVYFIWHSALWSWLAPLLLLLLYTVIRLRDIAIFAVHVYQRVAPDHIRDACVFTPTCSEYMILALKKIRVYPWRDQGDRQTEALPLPERRGRLSLIRF